MKQIASPTTPFITETESSLLCLEPLGVPFSASEHVAHWVFGCSSAAAKAGR